MTDRFFTEDNPVFCDDGARTLLQVRDNIQKLLTASGAFKAGHAIAGVTGDSSTMFAALDYLVNIGEIKRIGTDKSAGQDEIYVRG